MNWLTEQDLYYWDQGAFEKSYEKLGAHASADGCRFAVWAPNAEQVAVVGDFNGWNPSAHPLERAGSGLWQGHVPSAGIGQRYKYHVRRGAYEANKTDPYAFAIEPPADKGSSVEGLSSVITDLGYSWQDDEWMASRQGPAALHGPLSVYEVHLGSWRHRVHGSSLGYRDVADALADYVAGLHYTHVELLPVAEHPYYGSWGYQVLGYYAPTYRFGGPRDLMYLIDALHRRGIGVIIDWVPAHFATDPQGLVFFDGSTLYEYDDPQMRNHPDWGTYVFDYNKPGVRNFLVSNALFWLDKYHVDGLRVDAVASMLYRDYSRHEWTPNMFGGRENLEAIDLLKNTNEAIYLHFPTALTIAEESTDFKGVSAPTYDEGLGFLYKWNMGWMHDVLHYLGKDPVHRKWEQHRLTFSFMYAFSENYLLPLSHDEVVHGKGSLWARMPGDSWQKAANLRLLYGHQYGHPGKKLLFMGGEFGQPGEWNHDVSLDWSLLESAVHGGLQRWVADLNRLYRTHPALWRDDAEGWSWLTENADNGVLAYRRHNGGRALTFVFNMTPVQRDNYRIGVPEEGMYVECLNSDATAYGGSGKGNFGEVESAPVPYDGQHFSLALTLPALAVLVLERKNAP